MPKRYNVRSISTADLETYLNEMSRKGYNVVSVAPEQRTVLVSSDVAADAGPIPKSDNFTVVLENVYG